MFYIGDGNSVDNTGMFQLLLSKAYTELRSSLLLTLPNQRGVGWGCTRSCEGTQLAKLSPTEQRDILHRMRSFSAIKLRECGWFVVSNYFICITCLSWDLFLSLGYFPFHYNLLLLLYFISTCQLFFSQVIHFLALTLPILFPLLCFREDWVVAVWC